MKFLSISFLLPIFLFGSSPAIAEPGALKSGDPIASQFIVTFTDALSSAAVEDHHKWVDSLVAASKGKVAPGKKAGITYKYNINGFKAYAGVFSKDVVAQIKKRADVTSVDQDMFVTTTVPEGVNPLEATKRDEEHAADNMKRYHCISQALKQNETDGEWGLGRISHLMKFSTPKLGWPTYNYDSKNSYCNGKASGGGIAYVIDSGVLATHVEFSSTMGGTRAMMGYNAYPGWPNTDVCGHGTHVAGIIAGNKYGVMKKAMLIGVKVLEGTGGQCGGTWAQVIAGIDWAYKHSGEKNWREYSVINLSLGGNLYGPVNDALTKAIDGGLTAVVAAGNSYGSDACNYSPASVPNAITVGSTNIMDSISDYSNLGCCIDIYAPGQSIESAWCDGNYALLSGTSMASPMTAGVVLYNKCRFGYKTPKADLNGITNPSYSINNAITPFPPAACTNKMVYNRGNCY